MEFEFHFVRPEPRILNNAETQATLLRDADLDELRGTPDPEMEDFAQELGGILGADFPPRRLISASVDTDNPFAVNDVRRAAIKHRVSAYFGTSDLFVDASGISGAIAPEFYVTNSLGTAWAQVSERTIDWAFADALRAPVSEGVWVRITTYDPRPDEFGHSMRFHLLDSGEIKVVWARSTNEIFDVQWRQAVTYEEARAQLLAFADRCPTTLHHYWQDPQRHGNAPVAESSIKTCDLSQRSQYRLRRLGAFRELPPRVPLRLHDQFEFALELGKDQEGQWRASLKRSPYEGVEKNFESPDTLLEIAEAYTCKERGKVLDYFPETAEIPAPLAHTVSAVVLPERDEPWTNSSVCRMHLCAMSHNFAAVGSVENFFQKINRDFASWFDVIDPHNAERGQIKIKIPRKESNRAFDLLTAVAMRHGVSLVVDNSEVLFNSSGRRREGQWRSTAELFESGQCRNRWEVATPQVLLEAMVLNYSNWQLRLTYTSEDHPRCRQILIVEPNSQEHDRFTITAYESGSFFHEQWRSRTTREATSLSQGQTLDLIQQVAYEPLQLDEFIHWDSRLGYSLGPEELPFEISTHTRKSTSLDDRLFKKALREFASEEAGGWIEITDVRTPGDFLRIEPADNPGWVITKWGYNRGGTERGNVYASDMDAATEIYQSFVGDNWTSLDRRRIKVEPKRAHTPLYVHFPKTQTHTSHHELVHEFYAQEQPDLDVPPPGMEDVCRDLEGFLKQKYVPQQRVKILVDPVDTERIRGICQIAMKHHALVFDDDRGLLANGVGSDMQVGSGARLTNSLGSFWREVSGRTLDLAFEDALRPRHPTDVWLKVGIGRNFIRPSDTLSSTLEADGSWLMTWQFAETALGVHKKNLEFRASNYEEARELLLAFADRSPYLEHLPWQESEAKTTSENVTLVQRAAMPLRRFEAVLELPRGTMMPLQDKNGERLLFGQTRTGRWLAALSRDNGFVATRTFTSGQGVVEFARWYVAADVAEVNDVFKAFIPSLEERWAPRGMAEVSFLMLPQRAEPWADTTVVHFQHWLAQNNHAASEQMRGFVGALLEARSAGLQFTSSAGGAVEAQALTSVWVDRAGLLDTLTQMSNIAVAHGISMVVNGNHVLLNFAWTATDSSNICLMMKGTDSFTSKSWMQPSSAAFAQAIQRIADDEKVVVCNRIHTGPGVADEDFQEFLMVIETDKRGYCLSYELPGGMKNDAHDLSGGQVSDAFKIFVQSPTQLLGSVSWDSFGQSQMLTAELERFEMQSNLFEPVPLGADNLHELQAVRLPATGDFIQVLDSQVEGDYIRVYNDSGRFRTGFLVSWGHDFGQIENYQRKTKHLDEALKLVAHYVAGDRREFAGLGWKRREVKGR